MTADFILGPQLPISTSYFDRTQVERGLFHGRNFPATPPAGAELDAYTLKHYYDLGLSLAIAYKRTNDPEFLTLFRKVEDSWWKTPNWIEEGKIRQFDVQGTGPKSAGIGGLILRALDGRPEMWDWINAYTRYYFDLYCVTKINSPDLYIGIREGAFMLQYAAWLAKTLPDSFPLTAGGTETNGAALRAKYLADIENVAVNYYGRLQYPDGSWRWDDFYAVDEDGGQLRGITQPFQIGLALHALVNVYDLTTKETVKTNIQNQITKACRHLYSDGPYSTQLIPVFGVRLRGFHYLYHGGTTNNPTKYEKGDLPADFANWNPSWDVQNQRQPIGLLVAAYGWSYQRTGDLFFKAAGDELWDSAYGSTDGIHNYMAGDAKSYNQNCRWASSYLVWAGQPSQPEPAPAPTPTPTPSTPVVESPNNTRIPTTASQIVDSTGAIWTFTTNGIILRNGQGTGGQGSILLYCNRIVYAFGTDSQWYKWGNGWTAVGVVDPCASMTPTPTPVPPAPTPAPTTPALRKVEWPSGEAKQNAILDTQWKDRYRFKRHLSGSYAEFEKVT